MRVRVNATTGLGLEGTARAARHRAFEDALRPDEVLQLLYTSGTTGEPKGALHTSNTHFANIVEIVKRCGLTAEHVCFMPSPMAHQTGFAIGMELPLMLGSKIVLQDTWDAEVALQRIQDEGVHFMQKPFTLADLAVKVREALETDAPVVAA